MGFFWGGENFLTRKKNLLLPNSLQMEISYLDRRNSDRILTVAEWKARVLGDVTQFQRNVDIGIIWFAVDLKGRSKNMNINPVRPSD